MFYNIKKIILDYQVYNEFLSLSKEKNNLNIVGFFGKVSLQIPNDIIVRLEGPLVFLYFSERAEVSKVKTFNNLIIYSSISVLFYHFINLNIKGIGYKFGFDQTKNQLLVFNGNRLPVLFDLPKTIEVLMNNSIVSVSILGGDFILLNNFVHGIRKIAIPNKYKEIGIFIKKKL